MTRTALWLVLATGTPLLLGAQEVTGHLDGRVRNVDQLPVPGAQIIATSPALQGLRTTTTDTRGRFFLPALPVGVYRIQVRLVGLRPLAVDSVPIHLGATTSLPLVTLEPAPFDLAEVVVTAATAGYDATNTAQRLLLGARQLDALPLERNFREIMLLAPSAIPSFLGSGDNREGTNLAGATGFENTYFVDGINITSPIRGERSIDLPYNFIEQIDVRAGGATAENAQALGGVVNVVTPSGGNHFEGQLFGFYSSDALETAPRPVTGYHQTGFTFYDIGARVSGPVVRDRLWFFAAYNNNQEERDNRFAFGPLRTTRDQHLFAGKLTWQADDRTSVGITLLGDPSNLHSLTFPLFGTGVPQNREAIAQAQKIRGTGFSIRGRHQLGTMAWLDASISQVMRLEEGRAATAGGANPIFIDNVTGTLSGGVGFAGRHDSRRRSARLDLGWQLGSHALSAGFQLEELYGELDMDAGRATAGGTITRTDTSEYTWHTFRGVQARGYNRNPGGYLQDRWQLTPSLALTVGARWTRQTLRDAGSASVNSSFTVRDGIQPRLGAVYHPAGAAAHRVYASYSRAVEQIPIWVIQDWAQGAESLLVFHRDPRQDPTPDAVEYAFPYGAGTPADPDLRGHAVDTWIIGVDRRMGHGLSISLLAMRRALRRSVQNGTDTLGAFVWGNPGEGAMSHFPRPRRTYDALEARLEGVWARSWLRASYVLSRTRGNDPGLYGSDWRLGFTNFGPLYISPEQYRNATGLLPNDRTHVAKLFGSHRVGSRLDVGVSLLVASGTPLSEYGAISIPAPFRGFVKPRGTLGRMPAIWDLGLRLSYELPWQAEGSRRGRVLVDLQRIGAPRKAVDQNQVRYTCLDASGNQSCPAANYGQVTQYQRPMQVRLGFVLDIRQAP